MTITPTSLNSQSNMLLTFFQSQANQIQTALPVEVVAVNRNKRTVSLKSLISLVDNADQPVNYGIMANVPYMRLQAGSYGIIIDPKVGDKGIAVFCSRDISNVRNNNKPASRRKHSISDGIYIASLLNEEPRTWLKIEGDHVEITAAKVTINADTTINGNVNINGDTIIQGDNHQITALMNNIITGQGNVINGLVTIPQEVIIGKDTIPFTQHLHKYGGANTSKPKKPD